VEAQGTGEAGQSVVLRGLGFNRVFAETIVGQEGEWSVKFVITGPVPCRLSAESNGALAEIVLKGASEDCTTAAQPAQGPGP
jgi:hypothetical protein